MLYYYLAAFFTLMLISIVFNIYRKRTKSENVFVHALSFVPITGALMSLACLVGFAIVAVVVLLLTIPIGGVFNKITGVILLLGYLSVPVFVFFLGVFILWRFAKKNAKKYIYIAYSTVFLGSAIFGFVLCFCAMVYPMWHSQSVDDLFYYESKKLPAFCAEYELRLCFNSGKIVNLHTDTCGMSSYTLFELKNGDIFMRAKKDSYQNSYIVSLADEEVFFYKDEYKYKLKSEGMNGWGGSKGETLTIYPRDNIDGTSASYKAEPIKVEDIQERIPLGSLGVYHFKKHEKSLD